MLTVEVHGKDRSVNSLSMSVTIYRFKVTCLCLAELIMCLCQSSFIWRVNKSRQGFSEAGKNLITKVHHSAPVQLPSVNEAQSVLWVAYPLCRRFAHTLCQQSSTGLCLEGVRLFTSVAVWIDEVAEAEAGAWWWIVRVLLWKEVFPLGGG